MEVSQALGVNFYGVVVCDVSGKEEWTYLLNAEEHCYECDATVHEGVME